MELEEECTALIAQYEPRGRELRTVPMALGIMSDLERMADHAVNIAEAAGTLRGKMVAAPPADVVRMASAVTRMLNECITSFISEDPGLAASVCRNDDSADYLAAAILTDLHDGGQGDQAPCPVGRAPCAPARGMASILEARMKSLSCSPPIAWVNRVTFTFPHPIRMSG